MVQSAQGFLAGKATSMALGFGFWLVAARLYPATEVGLTGAVIASTMLAVQISLLGLDQSIIARYSAYEAGPARLVVRACVLVAAASLVCALLLLATAQLLVSELRAAAVDPAFAVLFVLMATGGTIAALFDRVSMAQHRGADTAIRNTVNGTLTIISLLALEPLGFAAGAREMFGCWVLGSSAALAIAAVQFRRSLPPNALPLPAPGPVRLVRSSLRWHALSLAERFPQVMLPIVVTEAVSTEANAHWYPIWMMAWATYMIPWSHAIALFAEASHDLPSLRERRRHSQISSLVTGCAAAVALAVAGGPVLALLGRDYAAAGWPPLVVLLTAVIPLTITGAYLAACRATSRVTEALLVATVSGVLSLAAAGAGGYVAGLVGVSLGWTAVQYALGIWARWRTNELIGATEPAQRMLPLRVYK